VILAVGQRVDVEALRGDVNAVLAPMGLRLSEPKTRVCHIDEGFDFLGWHIQRRAQRGRTDKMAIYTYPSKKSLAAIKDKVRTLTRRANHRTFADLLRRLNPVLRGWCNYSVTVCPSARSATSTTSPSGGWSGGCANDTWD